MPELACRKHPKRNAILCHFGLCYSPRWIQLWQLPSFI